VAQHQRLHVRIRVLDLQLLQDGDDEHCRLPHARFGLAQHVLAQDGLRNDLLLHCKRKQGV
jgi:hypothetical protein